MNKYRTKQLLKLILIAVLFLGVTITSTTFSVEAEVDAALLWLNPPSNTVPVGSTTDIVVQLDDVANVYGAAIGIIFDPAILAVVDADPIRAGVQISLGTCPIPDFVAENEADNFAGTILYGASSLLPSPPCNGGTVASIEFECLAGGTSPVGFTENLISDVDGVAIPVPTQGAEVTCGEENNLPYTPGNPTPPHNATGVSVTTDLYWTGGDPDPSDTVTYDVLFGTSSPPAALLCDDTPATTCNPGTLTENATYYWQVTATDNFGASRTGDIWQFTTTQVGGPLLWIDPPSETVPVSSTVTLDIAINDINNMYGAQLVLSFDPTKVEVVDADPSNAGVQITPGNCPVPDFVVLNEADNATGTISYGAISLNPTQPCNGNGVIASVTFHGLEETPGTPIHFANWILSDTDGFAIPVSTQDGTLEVTPQPPIVGTVTLQGRTDHSGAAISAWSGGVEIASTVTNPAGEFWLTVPAGTYDIIVEMARYLDGVRVGVLVNGGPLILPPVELSGGDANDDDLINVQDLAIVGSHFLMVCGDPLWDVRADINNDCIANILDLTLVGVNFHDVSPVPWP